MSCHHLWTCPQLKKNTTKARINLSNSKWGSVLVLFRHLVSNLRLDRPMPSLIACHECDLLQRETVLPPGGRACCSRCGVTLYRNIPGSLDRTLAYTLSAAVFFVLEIGRASCRERV